MLVDQLRGLGVPRGAVLVVHTAFSKIAPIEGGPSGLIAALREVLGPDGTLVMPAMSDDDDHPFDPDRTPCHGMGITAETFRRMPGVLRSDSPHSFAAIGPAAAEITKPHPVEVPHGLDSPIGRVFQLGGHVLLLGCGHDANTTIHLAENLANARYLRPKYATVMRNGAPTRVDYAELDHCCENFALLDEWLDAKGLQRRGPAGHGTARIMTSRAVVDAALQRLREREDVFLHPSEAKCEECDDARAHLRKTSP